VANDLPYEKRSDGILFHLHDEVKLLIRWTKTKTKTTCELWRNLEIVPPDTGNLNSATFRERLAKSAREKFGKENVPNVLDDLGLVALSLSSEVSDPDEDEDKKPQSLWDLLFGGMGPMDYMIKYAEEGATYFHTPEREAYATVKIETGHQETYPLRSRNYGLWLRREFHRREKERRKKEGTAQDEDKKPLIFPQRALGDVISHFESQALFEGPEEEVYVRVARRSDMIFVDLCDKAWRAVEISVDGWRVIPSEEVPVKFVRSKGMLPLPEPTESEATGALAKLRSLLNIGEDAEGARNWRLMLAWLVQAFTPTGPYPVLTLLGPQGAAKSTAQRILRNIVDASTVPLRSAPRDEHNLYIDARAGWVIALDNMSSLPMWLSDALCRLATGGGFSTRQLYTDQDQILFEAMRPVIVNGIGDVVTRPDLLDRSLIINLPPIPREARKLERVLDAEVEASKSGVLAALFTAVAVGLATLQSVKLDGLPRMADFARWGTATEQALGGDPGSFMAAYTASQDEAVETALESWPVVETLVIFARTFTEDEPWQGTATELFNILNGRADDDLKRGKDWPKQPNKLTEQLNRLGPSLAEIGVYVVRGASHKDGRKLKVFVRKARN
jgi:hypothetical protein